MQQQLPRKLPWPFVMKTLGIVESNALFNFGFAIQISLNLEFFFIFLISFPFSWAWAVAQRTSPESVCPRGRGVWLGDKDSQTGFWGKQFISDVKHG